MTRTGHALADWRQAHPDVDEAARSNGQRLAEWHHAHPEVSRANGQRLAADAAGAEARKRWRESPEGRATLIANGKRAGSRPR